MLHRQFICFIKDAPFKYFQESLTVNLVFLEAFSFITFANVTFYMRCTTSDVLFIINYLATCKSSRDALKLFYSLSALKLLN